MLLSEGQMSDCKGAALMLDALPKAKAMLGDRGNDRGLVAQRADRARHPVEGQPQNRDPHDRQLYRQRRRIENMFGRIKDWPRIHTGYDRCPRALLCRNGRDSRRNSSRVGAARVVRVCFSGNYIVYNCRSSARPIGFERNPAAEITANFWLAAERVSVYAR